MELRFLKGKWGFGSYKLQWRPDNVKGMSWIDVPMVDLGLEPEKPESHVHKHPKHTVNECFCEDKPEEKTWPCSKCGKGMTRAEGGTTFSVCESCWDKLKEPEKPEPSYPVKQLTHHWNDEKKQWTCECCKPKEKTMEWCSHFKFGGKEWQFIGDRYGDFVDKKVGDHVNYCYSCGTPRPKQKQKELREELAEKFELISTHILHFHDKENRTSNAQVIHKARFGEMADLAINFLKERKDEF